MDPQLLEYARIELTRALMDNSGKTKGQLQAFSEHPPADKERNPRKPLHIVELEDVLSWKMVREGSSREFSFVCTGDPVLTQTITADKRLRICCCTVAPGG